MSNLELKIPPLLLLLIFACLMWLVSLVTGNHELLLPYRYIGLVGFVLSGAVIAIAGVLAFRRASTTVNPLDPESSTTLVIAGIYRFTRNPMYLGFLLVLLGYGVYLANLYALLLVPGFVVYMNRFQIIPEERALRQVFGEDCREYLKQVRRWL